MKLTGKCKEDFNKYLVININNNKYPYSFYELPDPMKYGVYVDFFDSVSMNLYIKPVPTLKELKGRFGVYIDDFGHHLLSEYIYRDTRQEARCVIIEKANEIYNENKDNN